MQVKDAIQQRRSVKNYDPNHVMTEEEINTLLSHAILSPTAFNIQNWRFVVVEDTALRQQIRGAAFGQAQVTDASLLVILTADPALPLALPPPGPPVGCGMLPKKSGVRVPKPMATICQKMTPSGSSTRPVAAHMSSIMPRLRTVRRVRERGFTVSLPCRPAIRSRAGAGPGR